MTEPDAIKTRRRALGAQLAAHRLAARHSQGTLAPLTGYSRSTVANVETGRQRVPMDFWQRCDEALDTGGALTAEFAAIEGLERRRLKEQAEAKSLKRAELAQHQVAVLSTGQRTKVSSAAYWAPSADDACRDGWMLRTPDLAESLGKADDQLQLLAFRWLVAPEEMPPAHPAGLRRVGAEDVHRMRSVSRHLKSIDNTYGGGTAYPMALTFLRHEASSLLEGSYSDTTARMLFAATAELVLDVGWMAYDADDHGLARRYMIQSLRLSHACGDRMLGGRVLSAMSHQALHLGQVAQAIDLARAARSGTQHIATPTVVAMLSAMEACAQAAAGEDSLCRTAVADAERALGRARVGDENPLWLDFDEGGLWGHAARAFRDLGCAADAERYARRSVMLCQPRHDRTRAQRNAILATAVLQRRDADQAAALGLEIVHEAWRLQSHHVDQDVAALAQDLRATRTHAAADFLAQAEALLITRQPSSSLLVEHDLERLSQPAVRETGEGCVRLDPSA